MSNQDQTVKIIESLALLKDSIEKKKNAKNTPLETKELLKQVLEMNKIISEEVTNNSDRHAILNVKIDELTEANKNFAKELVLNFNQNSLKTDVDDLKIKYAYLDNELKTLTHAQTQQLSSILANQIESLAKSSSDALNLGKHLDVRLLNLESFAKKKFSDQEKINLILSELKTKINSDKNSSFSPQDLEPRVILLETQGQDTIKNLINVDNYSKQIGSKLSTFENNVNNVILQIQTNISNLSNTKPGSNPATLNHQDFSGEIKILGENLNILNERITNIPSAQDVSEIVSEIGNINQKIINVQKNSKKFEEQLEESLKRMSTLFENRIGSIDSEIKTLEKETAKKMEESIQRVLADVNAKINILNLIPKSKTDLGFSTILLSEYINDFIKKQNINTEKLAKFIKTTPEKLDVLLNNPPNWNLLTESDRKVFEDLFFWMKSNN